MAIPGTAIHYDLAAAQRVQLADLEQRTRHLQAVALNTFRNSFCDLYTLRDLVHTMNATGKDIRWLFRHAKFQHPAGALGTMASNAVRDGDLELQEFILLNCF